MGLESHIRCELERAASGFVHGEDYWFDNGLTLASKAAAKKVSDILDESGEFGSTKVVKVPTPGYISTRKETYKIEFGVHPMWLRK
jgi:hypothetical protein